MTPNQQIERLHLGIEQTKDATRLLILKGMSAYPPESFINAVWGTIATIVSTYFALTPEQQKDFLLPKTGTRQAILDVAEIEADQEIEKRKQQQQNPSNN